MTISFVKNEAIETIVTSAKDLLEDHWKELANNKEIISLAPDIAKYKMMQENGLLSNVVIYKEDKIIGYVILLNMPHMHYVNDIFSYVDVLYLDKAYRNSRLGLQLVDKAEELAKEAGATILLHHTKPHHVALERILKHKGYRHAETIFGKLLKD